MCFLYCCNKNAHLYSRFSTCRITSHLMMQTVLVFLSGPLENCNLAQTCYTMHSNSHPQSTEDIHHLLLDLLPAYTATPLHLFAQSSTKFQPQLGTLDESGCWTPFDFSLLTSPVISVHAWLPSSLIRALALDLGRSLDSGVWFLLCLKHWREKTKCLISSRCVRTCFQLSPPPTWSFISFQEVIVTTLAFKACQI